jgi:hypothetical protein
LRGKLAGLSGSNWSVTSRAYPISSAAVSSTVRAPRSATANPPSIPPYIDTDHLLAKHFAVGGSTGVSVDVRFLSATNEDIETRSATGGFRQDLLDRLREVREQAEVVLEDVRA